MPRVNPLAPEQVDPILVELVDEAQERLPQFMNQLLTLAHRPQIANDLVGMYLGFQDGSSVDRRYIELAILTVSRMNRCTYCVSHHTPLGQQAGLSSAALADLESGVHAESSHFSTLEKVIIAYAQQVTLDARRIPGSLFADLRSAFDDEQIVELTVRIGLANFFNRLNDALQIDIEPGVEIHLA